MISSRQGCLRVNDDLVRCAPALLQPLAHTPRLSLQVEGSQTLALPLPPLSLPPGDPSEEPGVSGGAAEAGEGRTVKMSVLPKLPLYFNAILPGIPVELSET